MLKKRKTKQEELEGIHLKDSIEDLLDKNQKTNTESKKVFINKCNGCEVCNLTKNMDRLFDHQREGVCWMMKQERGGLIADGMGMGKTRQTLAYLFIRNQITFLNKILIIVPCILKNQWQKEIEFWHPYDFCKKIQVLHYEQFYSQQTKNKLEHSLNSFDIEKKIEQNLFYNKEKITFDKSNNQELLTKNERMSECFDELILDECHILRNQGKIFQTILSLKKTKTWCLSGTPFINSVNDIQFILSLLELKNRVTLAKFYQNFVLRRENLVTNIEKEEIDISISHNCKDTSLMNQKESEIIETDKQNIDLFYLNELKSIISSKNNALFELTKQRLKLNLCSLPYNQPQQLDEFYKKIQLSSSMNHQNQILTNEELDQLKIWKSNHCKWKTLKDILKKHVLDHCIIFSYSASILKWLEIFSRLDFPSRSTYHLSGSSTDYSSIISCFSNTSLSSSMVPPKKRKMKLLNLDLHNEEDQKIINPSEKLSKEENYSNQGSILFMTLQLGNAGLNLTCANVVIFLEPWWNKAIEEQAQARIIRTGQTKKCFIYRFSSSHPLDNQIKELQNFKLSSIQKQFY